MKLYLITLVLVFLSLTCSAAKTEWPSWMVKIVKSLPQGERITGAGYIVKIKGALFVRTASHVTLGSAEQVQIIDYKGRPVVFRPAEFATNNMLDDQLIKIQSDDLQPLGIYNAVLKLFVVTRSAYQETIQLSRHVSLDYETVSKVPYFQPNMVISPPWVSRKQFRFEQLQSNPMLKVVGTIGYDAKYDEMRSSIGGDNLVANVSLIPGESGAPVLGWTDVTSLDMQDINFRILMDQAVKKCLVDELGAPIDAAVINEVTNTLFVIKGHAAAFHRKFKISMFTSVTAFRDLQERFDTHLGQDIGQTHWKHDETGTYRIFDDQKDRLAEIFSISDLSGDGTAADGGDGTAADGGSKADSTVSSEVGMLYNERRVVAFKLTNAADLKLGRYEAMKYYFEQASFLTANWQNFTLLKNIQTLNLNSIFEMVPGVDLADFFDQRFQYKIAGGVTKNAYSCRLSRSKLTQGVLSIEIQLGAIQGDELIHYESKLESFSNMTQFKSKNFGPVDIDFSRIWGLDARFTGLQFNPEADLDIFVLVRNKNYAQQKYDCVLY